MERKTWIYTVLEYSSLVLLLEALTVIALGGNYSFLGNPLGMLFRLIFAGAIYGLRRYRDAEKFKGEIWIIILVTLGLNPMIFPVAALGGLYYTAKSFLEK